ncbi:MAG: CRTAC1 family protein [Acidobacteriota bacterium]
MAVKHGQSVRWSHLLTSLLLWAPACELGASSGGPGRPAPSPVTFVDVTRQAGIDFVHSFGDEEFSNILEAVGGGVAWLDFDRDGWVDLYLVTGKYREGLSRGKRPRGRLRNRLYRNRGDGTFAEVTRRAGVGCVTCFSIATAVADYDNDGWPDIYVANHGPNVLYRNRGDGTFEDVTRRARVGDAGSSVGAAWLDFDRDGLLDLYVGNYVEFDPDYRLYYEPDGFPGPKAYAGQPDALYRNRGDGTFEDVSRRVGLKAGGRAMSVAAADLDADGYTDIYVTNDATENFLYRNIAGRRFDEVALMAGVAFNGMGEQTASMAIDFGDFDGDGRADIFVSDNALSSLYRNEGEMFVDVSPEAGIARSSAQFVGWGAFFFDFDNDGDLDIFKVNSDLSRLFGQEDQIYENLGGGRFRDVSRRMGPYFEEEMMGRGAGFADFDNDGDADIIIQNIGSRAVLLRNDGGNRNGSLTMLLRGRASNRDGVGAKVEVVAGGRRLAAEKRSTRGYLSQSDPRLLFGLGASGSAESVRVDWPSGRTQVLRNVRGGKTIIIEEPAE